jgi:hypothetical protein
LRDATDLAAISRDVCGIQAQVMGCAHLALWARASQLSKPTVNAALWEKRSLVKTSAMRQTLHLLAATDYHLYITALKASRMNALTRIMARIRVTPKEIDAMTAVLLDLLGNEPVPQRELVEKILPGINKKTRARLKLFWNAWPLFRPAIVEGLICYGPERGREVSFVRVDRWLPPAKPVDEAEAKKHLLRCYLRAYGPATLKDFSFWSGISMKEAKPIWDSVRDELTEASVEGTDMWLLRKDISELDAEDAGQPIVAFLPSFDPYMLAHVDKNHLIAKRHYKRVYRNQGWLSPVILVDGRVVGIWALKRNGKKPSLTTELLEKVPRKVLSQIQQESEKVLEFVKKA